MSLPRAIPTEIPHDVCRSFGFSQIEADVTTELRAKVAGKAISNATRKELLSQLAAGEIVELEIDFVAFQQLEGVPNRNFLRFPPGKLRAFARSFVNMPLLKNHAEHDVDERVGTVTASSSHRVEGGIEFLMTASVTEPSGVAAILRGLFDRFSIGWVPGPFDTIFCSVDQSPIFTVCSHFPGDMAFGDDDNELGRVEFIFQNPVGSEVSGINVPAVLGTHIDNIRAALSATVKTAAPPKPAKVKRMSKIALSLGLAADADDATIAEAIEAKTAALAAANTLAGKNKARQEALQAQLDASTARETAAKVDKLIADNPDRFEETRDGDGELVASEFETRIRAYASKDYDGAAGMLASAPMVAKAPTGDPAAKVLPNKPGAPAGNSVLNKQLKRLGLTPADFAKYNPINGSALDTADDDPSFNPRLWDA